MRLTTLSLTLAWLITLTALIPAEEPPLADRELAAWVGKRVEDWQPTPEERRFDEIGWAKDIREAERLAKEHNRPVFLFTHDGHMAVGRC
jgi:hypothetical protein